MRFLIGLLVCATAACAETTEFAPTENVVPTSHGSQPAASYEIKTSAEGDSKVKVDVWSQGAKQQGGQTLVDVTLSVTNRGNEPVRVDWKALRLEAYDDNGKSLPPGRLVSMNDPNNLAIGPGNARDIKARFALPGAIDPDYIGGLRLRWALDRGEGQEYVQFTSFQRVPDLYYYGYDSFYDPLWGYYDPFWYPYGFSRGAATPVIVRR